MLSRGKFLTEKSRKGLCFRAARKVRHLPFFRCSLLLILSAACFLISVGALFAAPLHHEIEVSLVPEEMWLQVEDRVQLPDGLLPDEKGYFHFQLHEGLKPGSPTAGVLISPETGLPPPPGGAEDLPVAVQYRVRLPIGLRVFTLSYEGSIHHPITSEGGTAGTISPEGIFLSGQSRWYPDFYTEHITFNLNIHLPEHWSAVSQGGRSRFSAEEDQVSLRWESPEPQQEIFLVGGKWTEYKRDSGRVLAMAFLRQPDAVLAERYLEATEQYLEMYQKLLGPYPYPKFALVENFWETGYGMPSFTLLGPRVLRLPFILHSSYPHEILHNWWGNGVFVNPLNGNWSEGLTTYLADYLIQEQHQNGLASRRATLQRYADYVRKNNDFPLNTFLSRSDAASQAVGYGKTLFLFHMLRKKLGDAVFVEALRAFYEEHLFQAASFDDLMLAFSRIARMDLSAEFTQWVDQKGAPILRARAVHSEQTETGYLLTARIEQRQRGPAYLLEIPLAISLQGEAEAYQTTVRMADKTYNLALPLPSRPIRLKIDPEFDLFRRLHPSEMPPSLSKVFGAESLLILLPSSAPEALRKGYEALAESWRKSGPGQVEIAWDDQIDALPEDQSVWLFGWENRFQDRVIAQLQDYGLSMNSAMTRIESVQIPRRGHSLVLAARHPEEPKQAIAWLATDLLEALPALGRKLPHYGPFGFLGFSGADARNVEKGRWPVVRSPMSIRVRQADGRWFKEKPASLRPRQSLASLSPLFSEKRMQKDIAYLSKKELKGRGFGSPGLDRAAEYIAAAFRRTGLRPGGPSRRSYLQQWRGKGGGLGSGITLKNVVGILPGRDPALAGEQIVIGAHYDHLGFGWPRVHPGDEGKLHPGANSNASGVALLLELARVLKQDHGLKRTLVFVAFTGGEVGQRGSKHFVEQEKRRARGPGPNTDPLLGKALTEGRGLFEEERSNALVNEGPGAGAPIGRTRIVGMINLDTLGQLQNRRLLVLGAASAREWAPLLREAAVQTGLQTAVLPGVAGEGDQLSFIQGGIPAVQLFGGASPESGRPGDTPDKIDLPGMRRIGRFLKELVKSLAERPEDLRPKPLLGVKPALIWRKRSAQE